MLRHPERVRQYRRRRRRHVQTNLWDNLVNILETQCPITFIVLLGLAIMAPLASNQALLESNQVLGTA